MAVMAWKPSKMQSMASKRRSPKMLPMTLPKTIMSSQCLLMKQLQLHLRLLLKQKRRRTKRPRLSTKQSKKPKTSWKKRSRLKLKKWKKKRKNSLKSWRRKMKRLRQSLPMRLLMNFPMRMTKRMLL